MINLILTVGKWILAAYTVIWFFTGLIITIGMIIEKTKNWNVDDTVVVIKIHIVTAFLLITIKVLSLDFPLL